MSEVGLLPESWDGLPVKFRQRLGRKAGRQRLMTWEDHMLLVLHVAPNRNETERSGRFLWRDPSGHWRSNDLGDGPEAIQRHLDEYSSKLEILEQKESEARHAQDYFDVLEGLTPVHRSIRNLHLVLKEARNTQKLDRDLIVSRDRSYALERTAELLYAGAKNNLDFVVARQAEVQAQASHAMAVSSYRLNILAAFFFPISLFTGLLGASYTKVLEGKVSLGFFAGVLGLGVFLGMILTFVVTRKPPRSD